MREVLIHLNVEVDEDLDDETAKRVALIIAVNAAQRGFSDFEELATLVDPQ